MITSLQNEQVKYVVSLQRSKAREEAKEFIIEGTHLLEEALNRGATISKVYFCPGKSNDELVRLRHRVSGAGTLIEEVDEKVLHKMATTEEPQGVVATVKLPQFTWSDLKIDSKTVLLILDGIQDPGNLGAILRTALAAGTTQVCLTSGTVDPYNPKVLRSTMGAVFGMTLLRNQKPEVVLDYCHTNSLQILTGDKNGENVFLNESLKLPLALVVGNEGSGPSPIFRNSKALRITIPMANKVESLNVAMATGILLYEIARRRDFL
ncbi:MAG: RNA methyltransferase [Desulfitobacterium hafniense]|nr:RNA methyltransferase [Desulfitobacterium hafniense]